MVNRFPEYTGKVTYVVIPDITKVALNILHTKGNENSQMTLIQDGAYDEAVKDVDAIIHAASPVVLKYNDPQGSESLAIK